MKGLKHKIHGGCTEPDTQINTLFSPLLLGTGHYLCEGGRRGWGLEHVFFFCVTIKST